MAITFKIKGHKDVQVQANDAIRHRQPTQTDTFKQPNWRNKRKYIDTTRLQMERTAGDVDIVFEASVDARLSIDYVKDQANVGFYYYDNIKNIAFFEHDTGDYITSINLPKGAYRPVTVPLSSLVKYGRTSTNVTYYQHFYEFWNKFNEINQDMDAGNLTSAITDHYDLNAINVGNQFNKFDLNAGTQSYDESLANL